MRKLTKLLLVSALSLCAVAGFSANSAVTTAATEDFSCKYEARNSDVNGDKSYMCYGSSAVNTYTAEEAAAAGIPAGYENEVFEVKYLTNATSCGVFLDFSEKQVPIDLVESLQFRIYLGYAAANTGSKPEIRIAQPFNINNAWIHQPGVATPVEEWTTVTVMKSDKFEYIAENGILSKFELSVRSNAQIPFYVDSIQYVLKKPTITYAGEDTVGISLGKELPVSASAVDAQGNAVDVQYVWEDGVILNDKGTPAQMGTYTLTLKAVDKYGSVATKTITVEVSEGDDVAPEIALNFTEVKTTVGAKPMLSVSATDNNGSVTLTKTWSKGALDNRGRLTAGTHTWTVTAVDKFGNTATKTVTFIVTADEPAYSFVTDEADLCGDCTVTFDGENPITVPYGFKVVRPADPVREGTAEATYKFLGWYVGDTEWDFENTPIFEDLNIVSKWKETKRLYRVYFDGVAYKDKLTYGSLIPEDAATEPTKQATDKEEYVFAGWYVGDKLWNFATDTITGDMQFESKFTAVPRKYTVTFDGENAQKYEYGAKVVQPEIPTKMDTETHTYEFLGWYNGTAKWDFSKDTVKKDINLVAKWQEIALGGDGTSEGDANSEADGSGASQSGTGNAIEGILGGCAGVVGGVAGGMVALGVATVALFKKKED